MLMRNPIFILAALLGLLGAGSRAAAAEEDEQKLDLYRLDWDDDDAILQMSDLSQFREMDSEAAADDEEDHELPDFSRATGVEVDAEPERTLTRLAPGAPTPEEWGEAWQAPENKLDLVRFFNGRYYQKQYGKINEHLVRVLPDSNNVERNLAEAHDWLERERKAGKNMFLNEATLEALEQFHNLSRVSEPQFKCGRHAYSILWKNDQATEGKAHRPPSKLAPPRRVDAIVHQVCMRHAIDCLYVYPTKYAQIRGEMEPEKRHSVETFIDNLLGSVDCVTTRLRSIHEHKELARHAFESIERHSHSDPDRRYLEKVVDERHGRMAVNTEKVAQLVDRYLVEPCQYFVHKLGPDVFIPARFDSLGLEREDRYQPESRELVEFLHGWIQYRMCDSLARNEWSQRMLVRKLTELIERGTY